MSGPSFSPCVTSASAEVDATSCGDRPTSRGMLRHAADSSTGLESARDRVKVGRELTPGRADMDTTCLIKKKELAARLSISPRTVDDLVAKRTIPYLAISARLHLFDLEAVRVALSQRFEVRAEGVRR